MPQRSDDETPAAPYRIAPGLYVLLPIHWEGEIGPYTVRLVVDVAGGRLGCKELAVTARGPETITGTALRTVPVATLVRDMVRSLVMQGSEGDGVISYEPLETAVDVKSGPTEDALRAVAASYAVAYALGDPPAKAVERDLGLAKSTAGRWISLARERGFLEISADQGRRA